MDDNILQPTATDKRPLECSAQSAGPEDPAVRFPENELVRRAREGEIGAFEELFKIHSRRVYNVALQMLGDNDDAADVTQEVFVRAYETIGSLKSDAAFVTWLRASVINRCRDALRKRGRHRIDSLDEPAAQKDGSTSAPEIADWSSNPQKSLDKKEIQESVRNAICSLAPEYREVVLLFYVDGADVAEIARALDCPDGTVKSRLSRARAQLKRKLEHYVRQ